MTWAYIMMVALTDRQLTDDAGDKDEEQIGSWHPTPRKKEKFPPRREKHTTLRTLCVYVRARSVGGVCYQGIHVCHASIDRPSPSNSTTNHFF